MTAVHPRTYLYVPADQEDKLAKARTAEVDALILDLEDSVAPDRKDTARANLRAWFAEPGAPGEPGPEVWVRVGADTVERDLAVLPRHGRAGVVLPKADPGSVGRADVLAGRWEERAGVRPGTVRVLALLETPEGMAAVDRVAGAPRVHRLGIGEADLAASLGLLPGPDRAELAPLRSALVLASAVARLPAPVGPVETAVHDTALLREGTRRLLRQGFRARTLLSPRQARAVTEELTPTAEEVERAEAVLAALERGGRGATVDRDGGFVDEAVARAAREVLSRAR